MNLDLYQVDAFAETVFSGNPAAVCPLEAWLDDEVLQAIALENNLAETAYVLPDQERGAGHYHLRWFTPAVEVDLCGHATLASGYVLWTYLGEASDEIVFATRSGDLRLTKDGDLISMDFPSSAGFKLEEAAALASAFPIKPVEILGTRGPFGIPMAVLETEAQVREFEFTAAMSEALKAGGFNDALIITGPADAGSANDCVSRLFAPYAGIPEDPVTGSIHTSIVPYWSDKLGKVDIQAYQASPRGGTLYCTNAGERVVLRGKCAPYMTGRIRIA